MITLRLLARILLVVQLGAACGEPPRERPGARAQRAPIDHDPEAERAPGWATAAGKSIEEGMQLGAAKRAAPPTVSDRAFDSSETVAIRRLVYRVSIAIPEGLRAPHPPLLPSPAELHLDVGVDRLRARFQGAAWPVDEGSEVRLRADVPGVYLFDGKGGRPLGPGHLASWFIGDESHPLGRAHVEIRRDPGPLLEGPAELVCAFVAEWTSHPREVLLPQCSGGAIPLGFRFGVWVADITAIVPMTMQRVQLRADSADAPRSLKASRMRPLLDPRDIARLPPFPMRSLPGLPPVDAVAADGGVLRVRNEARERVLVVVQGVPLAWLPPQAAAEFVGFTPGYYRVGGLRAFTSDIGTPAPFVIPGELVL